VDLGSTDQAGVSGAGAATGLPRLTDVDELDDDDDDDDFLAVAAAAAAAAVLAVAAAVGFTQASTTSSLRRTVHSNDN